MWFHPFLSVVIICSNTGEQLTSWMHIHPFSSVVMICSSTETQLTVWMCVHPSSQWFWSAQALESNSLAWYMFTHSISGSDLLTEEGLTAWMSVHPFLSVVLICFKHWRGTHFLDRCSPILVSGSDLLKHQRTTHKLMFTHTCQWF